MKYSVIVLLDEQHDDFPQFIKNLNYVFLDTEEVTNVALYQHLGYEIIGESNIEGLHSWHFFRADQ